jgi:outer membrane biosynthesis protein TonB
MREVERPLPSTRARCDQLTSLPSPPFLLLAAAEAGVWGGCVAAAAPAAAPAPAPSAPPPPPKAAVAAAPVAPAKPPPPPKAPKKAPPPPPKAALAPPPAPQAEPKAPPARIPQLPEEAPELCALKAYIMWEQSGMPDRDGDEEQREYKRGIEELNAELRAGLSWQVRVASSRGGASLALAPPAPSMRHAMLRAASSRLTLGFGFGKLPLESRPKAAARLVLAVSAGWASSSSRGLTNERH